MGLLDKAKQAAQQAAAAAKKGTEQVQGKIEHAQTRKKADELAGQLGYLIVRERTEGVAAGADADRLVGEITALQAQLTEAEAEAAPEAASPNGGSSTAAPPPMPPPTSASEPAAGDFKLD